jgi:hypothetical protein
MLIYQNYIETYRADVSLQGNKWDLQYIVMVELIRVFTYS